jgi:acetyltransferase-like isoleucine patch superfamily enzyme
METISGFYWRIKADLYYRKYFSHLGARSKLIRPLQLRNTRYIAIGAEVLINKYCWLLTLPVLEQPPELVISDGCVIGHFNHISCIDRVHIGPKVLTADRVFITDHGHEFADPTKPIVEQGIISRGPVVIGSGSWLGENVAVISCRIGKNCVIGANSVVLDDIPDFSVAVGAPARVVRRFNPQSNCWERISAVQSVA